MKEGVVVKSTGNLYWVKPLDGSDLARCVLKGNFKIKGLDTSNPIAVGDKVKFSEKKEGDGLIESIFERENYIIRKPNSNSRKKNIVASNLDQAILIATLVAPATSLGFVDRFVLTAQAYNIPVVILYNKTDLLAQEQMETLTYLKSVYASLGYICEAISAFNEADVARVKEIIKDKTSLIFGHSGVGKSTLINKLSSSLNLKTAGISEYHKKGRHTTTFAEMYDMPFGGSVIDTPGIKGFGIADVEKNELAHYFLEMSALIGQCKFHNCMHLEEPGCVIKQAVEAGEIAYSRYESYVSIYYDEEVKPY